MDNPMVMVYYKLVIAKPPRRTIDQVPEEFRQAVQDKIDAETKNEKSES